MPKYLLRRFAEMLITLFLIATATFFLLEAVPGDPLTERASKLSPTVKENLYKRYGLDKPMMERYVITMKGICKGEFGVVSVNPISSTSFPITGHPSAYVVRDASKTFSAAF